MSFDYKKSGNGHNSDSFWTSYSDLFLGLSTIFLLLYVVASLRTGTDAIRSQVENRKLTMQVEELEQQLKMYESVKSDYIKNQASQSEVEEYQELMDKLTLLQEEAKSEKDRLVVEALENQKKAKALNKYQQMVRNVLNANKLAKTKIDNRNDLIDDQDQTIADQKSNIKSLSNEISEKESKIRENEQRIATAEAEKVRNQKRLVAAFKANKMSKAQYRKKMKELSQQAKQKINSLQAENSDYQSQIQDLGQELKTSKNQVAQLDQALSQTQNDLSQSKSQVAKLDNELSQTQNQAAQLGRELTQSKNTVATLNNNINALNNNIDGLKAAHNQAMADARAKLDAEIKRGQLNAVQRAAKEKAFRDQLAAEKRQLDSRIQGLQGALAKAKEEIDARREVAREIKKGFARAGINADVDMNTGEVVLDFGKHYFDVDSARLKREMKEIIERAMPVYSRSLFGNKKVASKISAVEIVGFASPTYKGRYVDPRSSNPEDKEALKYNMDLSYQRANAIFGHLLELQGVSFEHQKDLLALMKVSGRSFLEVMRVPRRAPASAADFCKQNDCRKAQRVIVRFSMDAK